MVGKAGSGCDPVYEEKGIAIPSKKVGQSMMAQVFQTAQKEELL